MSIRPGCARCALRSPAVAEGAPYKRKHPSMKAPCASGSTCLAQPDVCSDGEAAAGEARCVLPLAQAERRRPAVELPATSNEQRASERRGERKTHLAPPAAASLNEHTARLREMRLAQPDVCSDSE